MWTTDGIVDFGGTGTIIPMRYAAEQAAVFVQGSYTFSTGFCGTLESFNQPRARSEAL
jgi:hypothetical protein